MKFPVIVFTLALLTLAVLSCGDQRTKIKKIYDPNIPCIPETVYVAVHDTVYVDKDDDPQYRK